MSLGTFLGGREQPNCDSRVAIGPDQEVTMAKDKMKPEDFPAQADKQASTDKAVREGTEGAQARAINKEQADKPKDD